MQVLVSLLLLSFGVFDTFNIKAAQITEVDRDDGARQCATYEPFRCPGGGDCIPLQYICDGTPDCPDDYDEGSRLCTAAARLPVVTVVTFMEALLKNHSPHYLEKFFGSKARDTLAALGGVRPVAIALSEIRSIDDFGKELNLSDADVENLRGIIEAVDNGDRDIYRPLELTGDEMNEFRAIIENLVKTKFLQ